MPPMRGDGLRDRLAILDGGGGLAFGGGAAPGEPRGGRVDGAALC